jgi:hypothetical protein
MDAHERQTTVTAASAVPSASPGQTLVLVAGSGRSGTSLFSGLLQRLGFHVPQPEVPADETNPRGFAESQWVVEFHARALRQAGVQVSDARPGAWAQLADLALDEHVVRQLRTWLRKQFSEADHIIIKDPRLSWFLPLWRRCAEEAGVQERIASVLRHPASVIDSKQRSYGAWQGEVGRAAGWLNQMLFTERASREAPRVFVRYEDLLEDWPRAVGRVGEVLDLSVVRDAPVSSMRCAHDFVDRSLSRSRTQWGEDVEIPTALREQAQEVWELLSQLADEDDGQLSDKLDAARARYVDLYSEAEAIAQSSVLAARGSRTSARPVSSRTIRFAARMFPDRYKSKVPPRWRAKIGRVLHQSGATRP